jgi:PAS domain S-box-containing protein
VRPLKVNANPLNSPILLELMDCADDFIFVLDPTLQIMMVNRCITAFSGYRESELKAMNLVELMDTGDRRRIERLIQGAKERRGGEIVLRTRSRGKVRIRFSISPLADSGGASQGYLMVGGLAGKEASSSISDPSEDLGKKILKGIADPAFIVAYPSHAIYDCNEAALTVFGYRRDELGGQPLLGFLVGSKERDKGEALSLRIDDAYSKIGFFYERLSFTLKNGLSLPCDSLGFPLSKADGSMDRRIIIFFDRSHEEQREAALSDLVEGIQRLASELAAIASKPSTGQKAKRLSELGFTSRQIDITRLVAQGSSSKEIGYRLGITESTVKNHLAAIFRKLNAGSRIDFMRILAEQRIHIS